MAQQWSDFRRALRKEDREAFDALMNRARLHASAATYAISLDPTESAVLSMLLEHEKELLRLRKGLKGVEERDGGHGSRDDLG
jgi:DNA-binding response OmpR family regulator